MVAEKTPNCVSPQQYLEQEEQAEFRSEYWNGEILAMSGGSAAHNRILRNLTRRLGNQLDGSTCDSFASESRVRISECNAYFYPDAFIVCGGAQTEATQMETVLNPVAILEVLSPSTEATDRGRKFACYRTLASLQYYVLIEQARPAIDLYTRQPDGGWLLTILSGPEAMLSLETVGVALPLSEIYQRVEFTPPVETSEMPAPAE